jgi:serine/threonine-protein kinase
MVHDAGADVRSARRRVGARLDDRWRLLRLLGVGGSSAVYEVIGSCGERAAVKLLSQRLPPATLALIASHEATLTRAVNHPGVVDMGSEVMTTDGAVYLPMELLVGETLEQRRRRAGGRLPLEVAIPIFDALLDIVAAAHESAIVHHDIKPSNVFLVWSGQVKLLDFGLARRAGHGCESSVWFGTPGFVAPEQARGEIGEAGGQADVWALGATMFFVLSGQHVHPAPTLAEEVALAASARARSLREAAPDLPAELIDVVDRALAFDREDRWSDVRALRAALPGAASVAERLSPERSGVHPRASSSASTVPAPSWAEAATGRLPAPLTVVTGTAC